MTDLNSGVDISAVVGPDTYEYEIEPGSWAVSPEVREHFGDELLGKINKRGAPRLPPGTPNTHIQKPSVGRIVHYTHAALVGDNGEGFPEIDLVTHAAMILSVGEGYNAFLHIHPAMTRLKELGSVAEYSHNMVEPPLPRDHYVKGTPFSQTPKPGHWSWPPRG